MQRNQLLKYILDVEQIIKEIEALRDTNETFHQFQFDWPTIQAIERDLQITGEAINNILKIRPEVNITSGRKIVDLRNLLVHSYDSIDSALLWSIIHIDIPILKTEIRSLKSTI